MNQDYLHRVSNPGSYLKWPNRPKLPSGRKVLLTMNHADIINAVEAQINDNDNKTNGGNDMNTATNLTGLYDLIDEIKGEEETKTTDENLPAVIQSDNSVGPFDLEAVVKRQLDNDFNIKAVDTYIETWRREFPNCEVMSESDVIAKVIKAKTEDDVEKIYQTAAESSWKAKKNQEIRDGEIDRIISEVVKPKVIGAVTRIHEINDMIKTLTEERDKLASGLGVDPETGHTKKSHQNDEKSRDEEKPASVRRTLRRPKTSFETRRFTYDDKGNEYEVLPDGSTKATGKSTRDGKPAASHSRSQYPKKEGAVRKAPRSMSPSNFARPENRPQPNKDNPNLKSAPILRKGMSNRQYNFSLVEEGKYTKEEIINKAVRLGYGSYDQCKTRLNGRLSELRNKGFTYPNGKKVFLQEDRNGVLSLR